MVQIHLKDILKERGKTAKWLAGELDVSEVAISNITRGKNYPTYDLLERMAQVLNVKMSTLLGEEPLRLVDNSKEFASFVRYKGIHYTADTLDEFFKQVDELRAISNQWGRQPLGRGEWRQPLGALPPYLPKGLFSSSPEHTPI